MLKSFREKWKKKAFRLKCCFYGLIVAGAIASAIDKIATFIALTYYGFYEMNPVVNWLMKTIGVGPACIVGFIATLIPMFLINCGIKKYDWDTEGHWWVLVILMTFYSALFIDVAIRNSSILLGLA